MLSAARHVLGLPLIGMVMLIIPLGKLLQLGMWCLLEIVYALEHTHRKRTGW